MIAHVALHLTSAGAYRARAFNSEGEYEATKVDDMQWEWYADAHDDVQRIFPDATVSVEP